jgi:hypothetical protein
LDLIDAHDRLNRITELEGGPPAGRVDLGDQQLSHVGSTCGSSGVGSILA